MGCGVLFGLVEGLEADVSGGSGRVGERARDGVQVVGADGHQAPFSAQRGNTSKIHPMQSRLHHSSAQSDLQMF